MRKLLLPALVAGLIARTANAADLGLSIEVPRLDVAEYHRPYVAIWIENPDQSVAADLAVWYDVAKKNNEGTEWLRTCASGGAAAAATSSSRWTA